MAKGWTCPGCGRGVAPGVATCDHGGTLDLKGRDVLPALPLMPSEWDWQRYVQPRPDHTGSPWFPPSHITD